ncbi:hypothetical protein [Streptomyces sp. NPDC048481]|uniref:hypothetical protein n=1 Tax=Streptomyces sp. NPDC048481 TaxID=3365557 RepID=UPI00371442CA
MSENASANELTSQYTAQVTADLERNAKERDRVGAEITALQEQLAALERDHGVLLSIRQAIGSAPAPAEAGESAGSPSVPAPRGRSAVASGARKRPQSKKSASRSARSPERPATRKRAAAGTGTAKAAAVKTDAPKTAAVETAPAKKAAVKTATAKKSTAKKDTGRAEAAKSPQPTLVDLVRAHLAQQREPRSAAEIATALGGTHPERTVRTTVVRTTLEGLVAKTQAQRTKQGSSVFYTAVDAPDATAPALTAGDEAAPDGA